MNDVADIDGLAAEYVLGSLPPAERLAVTTRIVKDRALANEVAAWQRRLGPLSHREPGVAPPPQSIELLLAGIARQAVVGQRSETVVVLRRANRWRIAAAGTAAASVGLAIVLGALIANKPASTSPFVAVLSKVADNTVADEPTVSTSPVFLVSCDPVTEILTVRQIAGRRPAAERSYVLWLMPQDGAPTKFIGLLSRTEPASRFRLSQVAPIAWKSSTLAISMESGGAMLTPTGPMLSTGKLEPPAP